MPIAPYTITIVQLQENVLIVDIECSSDALPIQAAASIGFQIIVEGYWVLRNGHLDTAPTDVSIQQLIEASPYQRQLNYWRQLLGGKEELLSLEESRYLDSLSEERLLALLRERQVKGYSRKGVFFALYRAPKPRTFQQLAKIFVINAQQDSDTRYTFEVYKKELLLHLTEGLSWGTGSFLPL